METPRGPGLAHRTPAINGTGRNYSGCGISEVAISSHFRFKAHVGGSMIVSDAGKFAAGPHPSCKRLLRGIRGPLPPTYRLPDQKTR